MNVAESHISALLNQSNKQLTNKKELIDTPHGKFDLAGKSAAINGWRLSKIFKETRDGCQTGVRIRSRAYPFPLFFGFNGPKISEQGRLFLANLLNKLSDEQIRELFIFSKFDNLSPLEDWVELFKSKREEINQKRCPAIF